MPNLEDFLSKVKKKGFQRKVHERPFYEKPATPVPSEKPDLGKTKVSEPKPAKKIAKPAQVEHVESKKIHSDSQIETNRVVPTAVQKDIGAMPRQHLVTAAPMPTQSLGISDNLPRQTVAELPRQELENSNSLKPAYLGWQIEMFKLFLHQKSDRNEVSVTYGELASRFGRDQSNIRKQLKKLMKDGLIEKVFSGWVNDSQRSILRLNIARLNEIIAHHEVHRMPRQIELSAPRHSVRSSSNNYNYSSTNTEQMPRHSNVIVDLNSIDLSKLPGVDRQKLRKFLSKYPDQESLQDFIDRVGAAIESQKGTKNEVTFPGAFLEKCFEHGVDVPAGYKSRRALAEEEALKRETEELEALKAIREKKKAIESQKAKLNFDAWLEQVAQNKAQEFEEERKKLFPTPNQFEFPASVKLKQLREIQVDRFLFETGTPETFRSVLLG